MNGAPEAKGTISGSRKEAEIEIKKYQTLIKKQDKLFCRKFLNQIL